VFIWRSNRDSKLGKSLRGREGEKGVKGGQSFLGSVRLCSPTGDGVARFSSHLGEATINSHNCIPFLLKNWEKQYRGEGFNLGEEQLSKM